MARPALSLPRPRRLVAPAAVLVTEHLPAEHAALAVGRTAAWRTTRHQGRLALRSEVASDAQTPARRLAVSGLLLVQVACLLLFLNGMGTILLVIVVLMLLGAIPTWPHSRGWGYAPSGGIGLILLILVILLLSGRL